MADVTQKLSESAEEDLLKTIRGDYTYVKEYWRENYEEAEKDMNCVACIPPPDFILDRAGRPVIWPDETSQYVKQHNNGFRQNKRSIKVSPKGEGAEAKDAEHRQAYIRGIEYASRAASIYSTAGEALANCGMCFWRVNTRVTGPKGEQEPRIVRIPNQFTCYADPDAKEADFSDSDLYFVLDRLRQTKFGKKYPKAKKKSFDRTDQERAPGWFIGQDLVLAEAWGRDKIEEKDGESTYKVTQHITNGIEILETHEWIGSWIPIIGCFGEELYIRTGGESKRMFLSMVRRARGAQQMMAYIASQEAEEFGMAPRAPIQGFKGQFDPEQHKLIHKIPKAYLEFALPLEWQPSWGPPPLPTRTQFLPNSQAYEISYERWRRSHQAAMGVTPLPSSAQRQNEKSGIALEKIQTQEAIGSFHITDNLVGGIANTGRQVNELITKLAELDSLPKHLLGRDQKDEDRTLHVMPQSGNLPAGSEHLDEADVFFAHRGQFEVTCADGPNYQSQREEASAFSDTLLQTLPSMGLPPQIIQQILAIAVKLKNIGTYGDEIHDLLSPPDPNNLPPQAKALLAQAQGQMQQLKQELQKLQLEKLGKVIEIQGKEKLAQTEHASRMAEADKDREVKLAVAEITTKAQSMTERVAAVEDLMKQFHEQAHEIALLAQGHQHATEMADQAAANAQVSQASDQDHQTAMAEQAQQAQAEAVNPATPSSAQ